MIIDRSALVAVLDKEPEAERIVRTLASAPERILSAANLVELGIAISRARHFGVMGLIRRDDCYVSPQFIVAAPGLHHVAGDDMRPISILAIVLLMPWQRTRQPHCCSNATISARQI